MLSKKLLSALCVALMVIGLAACEKKGPAEAAGEKIDNAAEQMGDKVEEATDKASQEIKEAGEKLEDKTDK